MGIDLSHLLGVSGLLEEDEKGDGEACCSAQGDVDLECSVMEGHSLYF